MAFHDHILPEFDHEMTVTRSLLVLVPFDRADYQPATKSRKLGELASHIANLAGYGALIATGDGADTATRPRPPVFTSSDEMLAAFDANVAKSREAILTLPADQATTTWTLRAGPNVIFSLPRTAVFRSMLMSHMIHHRGQLSVYLRGQGDVKLPSIYGPTADT